MITGTSSRASASSIVRFWYEAHLVPTLPTSETSNRVQTSKISSSSLGPHLERQCHETSRSQHPIAESQFDVPYICSFQITKPFEFRECHARLVKVYMQGPLVHADVQVEGGNRRVARLGNAQLKVRMCSGLFKEDLPTIVACISRASMPANTPPYDLIPSISIAMVMIAGSSTMRLFIAESGNVLAFGNEQNWKWRPASVGSGELRYACGERFRMSGPLLFPRKTMEIQGLPKAMIIRTRFRVSRIRRCDAAEADI